MEGVPPPPSAPRSLGVKVLPRHPLPLLPLVRLLPPLSHLLPLHRILLRNPRRTRPCRPRQHQRHRRSPFLLRLFRQQFLELQSRFIL